MNIENNILKSYLKNVLFITGTAYAGKSTMCAMLAEKYDLYHCGENYKLDEFLEIATPDKAFLLRQIGKSENPEKTMNNYRECIARVNSKEHYEEYATSGFFTIIREEIDKDTRQETLALLEKHFCLV